MSQTQDAPRSQQYTSPTSVAPVVVGYDGGDGGRDALELARVLATIRGARCIVATGLLYGPVSVHRAISDEESAEVASLFDEARETLTGCEVESHVIGTRSPGRMLLECAERERAGTLVVGSPHRGSLGRAILGSVAEHVLHRAPCEVVVAPQGYRSESHLGLRKIAVAVDGSEGSKIALTRAEDLARGAGATIEIIVAEDPVVAGLEAEFSLSAPDAPRSAADVLRGAVDSVDPALKPTGKRIDPGWRQVVSTIAAGLADACTPDVDLLVTGSRPRSERLWLGSVTKFLIAEAPCPVLVVPETKEV